MMRYLPVVEVIAMVLTIAGAQAAVAQGQMDDPVASGAADGAPLRPAAVLEEAWSIVNREFFDPQFRGVDWNAALEHYRPKADAAVSRDELARVINDMLAELKTSHMAYYTPDDREYYELLDIYNQGDFASEVKRVFPDGVVAYRGIGFATKEIDGKHFIVDMPAHVRVSGAAPVVGAEIVSVDGKPFHPIRSFRDSRADSVVIQMAIGGQRHVRTIAFPRPINPHDEFLQSIPGSAQLIEQDDRAIGYVRVRSYASPDYHEALKQTLFLGPLSRADALVLDIRGGWGGAQPEYLSLFSSDLPSLTYVHRTGALVAVDSQWRKPVVLLVDEGTRSGKEVFAYGFKKRSIGPIVGMRTAGAVVGGRPFLLSDHCLLMVAVADVLVDGERLEGVGVEPDVEVPFDVPSARGRDAQLQKAIEVAAGMAAQSDPRDPQ